LQNKLIIGVHPNHVSHFKQQFRRQQKQAEKQAKLDQQIQLRKNGKIKINSS